MFNSNSTVSRKLV